jgi:paraquat-inducible protein A
MTTPAVDAVSRSDRASHARLTGCAHCGLVQRLPVARADATVLRCARCGARLSAAHSSEASGRATARAAALALAALLLYPAAMLLPVIEISKMGHTQNATILKGVVELMREGEWLVGLIVLVCSVVAPLAKIGGMFLVCVGGGISSQSQRQHVFRAIEWIGRWGMIDVLLVAVLVAAVKLGSWADVHAGPGALAFAGVVLLSLLASACFDPRAIWQEKLA